MEITVEVFASLKEIFEKEFSVSVADDTIAALRAELGKTPEAEARLSVCRFANNEGIVDEDYRIQPGERIFIFPPSSGG